jgi:3'-phosphoadenosine 5'-phosphosulfate sulfotransferase (PAPS reductase)/FAD synthetase
MTKHHGNGKRRRGLSFDEAWAEAATLVASKGLRGLTVKCPACHRKGTAFSKWVRGVREKPLYVCHINRGGCLDACQLTREDAASVKKDLSILGEDVVKLIRLGRPFALFSGGKDSLCLVARMRKLAKAAGRDLTAVHAETTAGFPEVETYVQTVCKQLGVPLTVVHPHRDFFETAKRWGIPSPRSRWCCETLKVAPMRRYLQTIDGTKVIFDGIRAAESTGRAKYTPVWYHPTFRCISVSPIFYWSDQQINQYIRRENLPESPAVRLNTSAECWCGAYQGKDDFESLLSMHPEIFDKLLEVENAQKGKYTFLFEKGQRIPLVQLKIAPNPQLRGPSIKCTEQAAPTDAIPQIVD